MKFLGIALLLISSSALASSKGYDLTMDLSLEGKHIASPRVTLKEGKTATVTQMTETGEKFIEVTVAEGTLQNHKGILMKFTIGTIGKNGERTILAKPQVLAKEGEPAKITQADDKSGVEHLSLSVVAKSKSL